MSKTQSSESYSLLKFNPTSENPLIVETGLRPVSTILLLSICQNTSDRNTCYSRLIILCQAILYL
jgi:hypothetical protein